MHGVSSSTRVWGPGCRSQGQRLARGQVLSRHDECRQGQQGRPPYGTAQRGQHRNWYTKNAGVVKTTWALSVAYAGDRSLLARLIALRTDDQGVRHDLIEQRGSVQLLCVLGAQVLLDNH